MNLEIEPRNTAVWRYTLQLNAIEGGQFDLQLEVPMGAQVMLAGHAPGGPMSVWCAVDPTAEKRETLDLFCVGTGHGVIAHPSHYLGSVTDGTFVWHVFQRTGRRGVLTDAR